MTTFAKWKMLNQVNSYTPIDTAKLKTQLDQKVINSIKIKDPHSLFNMEMFYKGLSSSKFEQSYTDAIIKMIQKEFPSCQDKVSFNNLFDPGETSIQLTKGWGTIKDPTEMLTALNKLIENIKKLLHVAFPTLTQLENYKQLQQSTGEEFFRELANSFKTMPALYANNAGHNVTQFSAACESLANAYPGLINEKGINKDSLSNLVGNMPSIVGSAIWENIAAIAREKVLKELFDQVIEPIKESYKQSGGTVISKTEYKQTGTETINGQSIVGDSLVTMSLIDSNDNVILEVIVTDSTKFSQSKSGYFIKPIEKMVIHDLRYWLGKIRKRTYWTKRMGAYLISPIEGRAKWRNIDIEAWNNTREAIYLKSLYDTIAVRIGGQSATTFSLNGNIATVANFIATYTSNVKTGQGGFIQNIKNLGEGYDNYVENQLKNSSGSSQSDESELRARYNQYINTILNTKIEISANIVKGFT